MSGSPLLHSSTVTPRWPDVPSANSCYTSPAVHTSRYSAGDMYSPLAPRRNSEYEHAQHFPGFAYINGEATTGWAKWLYPSESLRPRGDVCMCKAVCKAGQINQRQPIFNIITENVFVWEWHCVRDVCIGVVSVYSAGCQWNSFRKRNHCESAKKAVSQLCLSLPVYHLSLMSIIGHSLIYCAKTLIADLIST